MVTISGSFKYQDSSPVAHGILVLELSQPCTISGTGQVAPSVQRVQLDAAGAIPGGTQVYGNDQLTPSGTVYSATVYSGGKDASGAYVPAGQISNTNWSLTGTSVDVSTLVPTGPSVSYPAVVSSLVLPAEFAQSTSSGVVTITKANESANQVWAGPASGPAGSPSFRAIVGADLPAPQAAALGGVKSLAAVSHNFLTQIGTDGTPAQAQPALADLSDSSAVATLTGAQTLSSKTLTNPKLTASSTIQDSAGAVSMGITQKVGTGAGDYTTASTSYADVDATNLSFTTTIPTGWKLAVIASGNAAILTATNFIGVAIFDSVAAAIVIEQFLNLPSVNQQQPFSLNTVIVGDGASHTVKLQFKTNSAADSAKVNNSSSTNKPSMMFILMPSN